MDPCSKQLTDVLAAASLCSCPCSPLLTLAQLPALCDMTASTMMNIGLLMTSASVYQM